MPYISHEALQAAKQMDLLTYLQLNDPQNLVHLSGNTYCTKEHDSLKISNGKWHWFSQHIGGRSALDYLMKVKGFSLPDAVNSINGYISTAPIPQRREPPKPQEKRLLLPPKSDSANHVRSYLKGRGIHEVVIDFCLDNDLLYEDSKFHSAVFVGRDMAGKVRYASIRSTSGTYKGEATGSDKHFSFHLPGWSNTVHVFEAAIDAMSYATLELYQRQDWHQDHLLSLAGVFKTSRDDVVPVALEQYLRDHPQISTIRLHLDNDEIGRAAVAGIVRGLHGRYQIFDEPPRTGKDVNDHLLNKIHLQNKEEIR